MFFFQFFLVQLLLITLLIHRCHRFFKLIGEPHSNFSNYIVINFDLCGRQKNRLKIKKSQGLPSNTGGLNDPYCIFYCQTLLVTNGENMAKLHYNQK